MFYAADLSPFVLALGWIPLIAAGVGALGSWLGGRSQSKQHQRQLASEERRQAMHQLAVDAWMKDQREQQAAAQAQRAAMIRQLAPQLGIDPGMAAMAAAAAPTAPMAMPRFGAVATQGTPPAQRFDYGALLSQVLGPQAQGDPTLLGLPAIPSWLGGGRRTTEGTGTTGVRTVAGGAVVPRAGGTA